MEVVNERQWLKARQTKYAAYATVYILVILAHRLGGECSGQPLQQVLRLHLEQALQPFRPDRQDREGAEAGRHHHLFRPDHAASQTGKDLLDRYANLSPKVHVDYVDPDKNPQLARAADISNYGTAVVQIGAKKEEAKSMTEEGITGAIIRDLKSNTRTVCFVTGSGEQPDRRHRSRRLFAPQGSAGQGRATATKSINLLQKAEVPGRLHGARRRRPEQRLPAARSRCHQEIRRKRRARVLHAGSAAKFGRSDDCR